MVKKYKVSPGDPLVLGTHETAKGLNFAVRIPFPLAKKTFCVDHHISNPLFADINVVDADASSCAEVLYNLMDPAKIDLDTATSLYTRPAYETLRRFGGESACNLNWRVL